MALMLCGVADAATLCREGDVPTSKIYQAMEKLAGLGLVQIQQTRPRMFAALPADAVVARVVEIARERAERFASQRAGAAGDLRRPQGPRPRAPAVPRSGLGRRRPRAAPSAAAHRGPHPHPVLPRGRRSQGDRCRDCRRLPDPPAHRPQRRRARRRASRRLRLHLPDRRRAGRVPEGAPARSAAGHRRPLLRRAGPPVPRRRRGHGGAAARSPVREGRAIRLADGPRSRAGREPRRRLPGAVAQGDAQPARSQRRSARRAASPPRTSRRAARRRARRAAPPDRRS